MLPKAIAKATRPRSKAKARPKKTGGGKGRSY